jgi:hypothetical protein
MVTEPPAIDIPSGSPKKKEVKFYTKVEHDSDDGGLGSPRMLHARKEDSGPSLYRERHVAQLTRDQQIYKDELIEMVKRYIEVMGKENPTARIENFSAETAARKVL